MRIVAVLLALVVALAGPARAETAPSAPVLKLIDAGKDAKTSLRLAGKKGAKKKLTMSMTMSIATKAGGKENKISVPPIDVSMDMKVTDVAANGDLAIEMTFGKFALKADAKTPKAMVDAFKKMSSGIEGIKGSIRLTSRGYTLETVLDSPDTLPPETAQLLDSVRSMMAQVSTPLPEEPVGVGAKWETTSTIRDSNGIDLDQTQTTEIIGIKGKQTTVKVTVKQSAKPKKIKIKGMDFDLKSVSGGGSGENILDATTFIPVSGKVDVLTTISLANGGNVIDTTVAMNMSMKVR